MGNLVNHWITKILFSLFKKLCYQNNDVIKLIMFHSNVNELNLTVSDFPSCTENAQGMTYMASAISSLKAYLATLPAGSSVRVLTISDGGVHDQAETVTLASQVKNFVDSHGLTVNSQAVRLFSSSNQPDTRAVSSVLQLNTTSTPTLLDIPADLADDTVVNMILPLFDDDGLAKKSFISARHDLFLNTPWTAAAPNTSTRINPTQRTQMLWLLRAPEGELLINDSVPVRVVVHETLTEGAYVDVMSSKLDFYLTQIKLLKIVNTATSSANAVAIYEYFRALERSIDRDTEDTDALKKDLSILNRVKLLHKLTHLNASLFAIRMGEIANDERIAAFNSAQSAEYLRSVSSSKTAKGLVRRAGDDLDFAGNVREEIKAIAEHIDELAYIEDYEHATSFCSLSTTLDGLRALAQLTKEEASFSPFDMLSINDILECVNFVGVPVTATTGDFPDPFRYTVKQMFPGTYVALSDVLISSTINRDELRLPGSQEPITNVIPFFDDERVQAFVMKYAPRLFSYTCSVGMRRVIADVPRTVTATLGAGLTKMIQMLHGNKTKVNIDTVMKVLKTFLNCCGPNARRNEASLVASEHVDTSKLKFTGNSLSQLLLLLVREIEASSSVTNNVFQFAPHVQAFMRAVYVGEAWTVVRRLYKNKEQCNQIVEELLNSFLGIDKDRFIPALKPLFEADMKTEDMIFHRERETEKAAELVESLKWLDSIFLLPQYLLALTKNNTEALHSIETYSTLDEAACVSMGLECPISELKTSAVFLALAYPTSETRNNIPSCTEPHIGESLLPDVRTSGAVEKLMWETVNRIYREEYEARLKAKLSDEIKCIAQEVVEAIATLPLSEALCVWRDGISKAGHSHTIASTNRAAPCETYRQDKGGARPPREAASRDDVAVWNKGSVLFVTRLNSIAAVFLSAEEKDEWAEIAELYRKRKQHTYRDAPNRHSNHNGKRSYWAIGFNSLDAMVEAVSAEEWKEYCAVHTDCCGLSVKRTKR